MPNMKYWLKQYLSSILDIRGEEYCSENSNLSKWCELWSARWKFFLNQRNNIYVNILLHPHDYRNQAVPAQT